jgi:hypothetical protein
MGQFDLDIVQESVELENNNTINDISTNLIIENIFNNLKSSTVEKAIIKYPNYNNTYKIIYKQLYDSIEVFLTIKDNEVIVVLDNSLPFHGKGGTPHPIMHEIISELNVIIKNISKIYNSVGDKKIYITHCIAGRFMSYAMKNICGLNPYYFYIINKLYTTYGIEPIFLRTPYILETLDNSIIDINANINTELETIYVFPFITSIEGDPNFLEMQECYYFTVIILENDVYIKHKYNVLSGFPYNDDYYNFYAYNYDYTTSDNRLFTQYMKASQFKNIKPIPCTFKGKDDVCIGKKKASLNFLVYALSEEEYDIAVSRLVIIYTLFYKVKELLYIHRGEEKEYMFKDPDLIVYKMANRFNKHPEEVLHDIKARYNWICTNYVNELNNLIKKYKAKK